MIKIHFHVSGEITNLKKDSKKTILWGFSTVIFEKENIRYQRKGYIETKLNLQLWNKKLKNIIWVNGIAPQIQCEEKITMIPRTILRVKLTPNELGKTPKE